MKNKSTISWIFVSVALASLSCSTFGQWVASPTPTPTNTPTVTPSPTATNTLSPTNTPRPTHTRTPVATPSVLLDYSEPDGVHFLDKYAGFSIVIPRQYHLIDASNGQAAVFETIEETIDEMPELSPFGQVFSSTAGEYIRLLGVQVGSDYFYIGFTTNFNVVFIPDPQISAISLYFYLTLTRESIEESMEFTEVSGPVLRTTSQGVQLGQLELVMQLSGISQPVVQHQTYFKTAQGLAIISFGSIQDAYADLEATISAVEESIQFYP